jgi:hypothetical protein
MQAVPQHQIREAENEAHPPNPALRTLRVSGPADDLSIVSDLDWTKAVTEAEINLILGKLGGMIETIVEEGCR